MRFLLLFCLVACTTPSPDLIIARAPSQVVEVGSNTYKVFYTDETVQTVRLNHRPKESLEELQQQAVTAAEMVTGCKVQLGSLRGDAVRNDAKIKC